MDWEQQLLQKIRAYYDECIINSPDFSSKKLRRLIGHLQEVRGIAEEILKRVKPEFSEKELQLVIIAAYLHDIEKIAYGKAHALKAGDFIEGHIEWFEELGLSQMEIKRLKPMVIYHNKGFYKSGSEIVDTENSQRDELTKIIQDADKISKIYKAKGDDYMTLWNAAYKNSEEEARYRKKIILKITKKGLNFESSYEVFKERYMDYMASIAEDRSNK